MAVAGVELKPQQQKGPLDFFLKDTRGRTALLCAALMALTIALYFPVRAFAFFNLDDQYYIVDNPHLHDGINLKSIGWSFSTLTRQNWIPLSFLSHALDYSLFGRNAGGHHAMNVLFHALNAALLFWVLKRATGYVGRSFMVAALFAVHPMNVEAVAWVAERKTVLSMVFFLLGLAVYRWYVSQPTDGRYRVLALVYALGLSAKAQIITLPAVFLLWDFWPLQRMSLGQELSPEAKVPPFPQKSFVWLIKEKISLLLIAAAAAMLTFYSEGGARPRYWPPLSERLSNAVFSYSQYIAKAFCPMNLAPMYPNRGTSLALWQVGASVLLLLIVTGLVLLGRRHRYLPVGWFWFLGTLLPMIEIFQFGKEGMADRFSYEALIGLFIMVCWGCSDWVQQRRLSTAWLAASGMAAVLALTMATHRQLSYWEYPEKMWWHALEVVPNDWIAEGQVGRFLALKGKEQEALQHYRRAIAVHPDDSLSNLSLGIYEQQHGDPTSALARYEIALQDMSIERKDRANIYQNMSVAYRDLGDHAKAHEAYQKAVELREEDAAHPKD